MFSKYDGGEHAGKMVPNYTIDVIVSLKDIFFYLFYAVSTCNLCGDLKFRCSHGISNCFKMLRDHRYFQFAK